MKTPTCCSVVLLEKPKGEDESVGLPVKSSGIGFGYMSDKIKF
jgi:hypothetical protein